MAKNKSYAAAVSASDPSSSSSLSATTIDSSRAANQKDKNTLSNYQAVKTQHLKLQLNVDFGRYVLDGWAEHTMVVLQSGAPSSRAIFDTSSGLRVHKAEVNGVEAAFTFGAPHAVFGTPLEVSLAAAGVLHKGNTLIVRIYYTTTPTASACQWLPPAQTAGKKHPYLFTQSQAIHARSIFPCQDAPAVKMTYSARVRVPQWATALMSALRSEEKEFVDGAGCRTYVWEQPVSMPSYLVALAVGDLQSRDISPRCRVWAEPSMVEAARYEFDQTEEFLQHAEALTCDYVWTRYDILCLPPSFPYGGMENPCLTFATPTLLAGDRSLADVIAHEIAHSWTGNLVTNTTWEHFYLNEGWTMWLQRKIMARIHGDPMIFELDAEWLGWPHLEESVAAFKDQMELTALVPDLTGVDPDDAFSSIPYEKGFSLLVRLERIVGTVEFERFAKHYIHTFQYKTVTSAEFKQTLLDFFKQDPRLVSLPWDEIFYEPGLPPKPVYETERLAGPSLALADAWFEGGREGGKEGGGVFARWTTLQKQIFLERLLGRMEKEGRMMGVPVLEAMDREYQLSSSKNAEIRFRWTVLCLRAGAKFVVGNALDFVTSQGRMKFTRPLYKELYKSKMASSLALEIFKKNAMFYHPICRKMVAADLGLRLASDGTLEEGPMEGGKKRGVKDVKWGWGEGCPLSQEAMLLVGVGLGAAMLAGLFVLLRQKRK
ncbi:leukotriene a4 hydrolase [Nannochloropsis oceanica]